MHDKVKLIPAGRPGLDCRQPNMSHLPPHPSRGGDSHQQARQVVVVTRVQEGGLVTGQLVSAAARQTLQFLSCKLPAAELLMTRVDRVEDLDHTLLFGTKVKGELLRCQTQLAREPITRKDVPVILIDWGTATRVNLDSLFHLPQELAALRPVVGWFRLRGCGHAGVMDFDRLVGREVQMEEVDTGIFNCYCDGDLINELQCENLL